MKSMIYDNRPGVVTSQGFMPGRSMYSVAMDSTPSIMGPDVEIGTWYVVLYVHTTRHDDRRSAPA